MPQRALLGLMQIRLKTTRYRPILSQFEDRRQLAPRLHPLLGMSDANARQFVLADFFALSFQLFFRCAVVTVLLGFWTAPLSGQDVGNSAAWRRTVNGWERADLWPKTTHCQNVSPTPRSEILPHPLVLAGFVGLASTAALLAVPPRHRYERCNHLAIRARARGRCRKRPKALNPAISS